MAEGKQGFVERFLEPHPFWWALAVLFFFGVVCVLGASYLGKPAESGIFPSNVNEWGDFLAGIFAPAALFFLALSVRIQSRELGAAVKAQEEMKLEMALQVSQMKFGGMAPFFHEKVREAYESFDKTEISAIYNFKIGILNDNYEHVCSDSDIKAIANKIGVYNSKSDSR